MPELIRRVLAGNRNYFAVVGHFRNRPLSRATKIRLYKTLIRPVVTYGVEIWTMTKKEKQVLLIFERKIFRRIYGPKDRLCGLVVRVSGYRYRGPGFDSRRYQIF